MSNHHKITVLAALALLLIGLSACDNGGSTGTVFAGGTNGLLFSFEEDTPPDLIYDNSQTPFSIIVKAQNDGEFDTQNIDWRITGINGNDFEGLDLSDTYEETIMGRTKLQDDEIEGEEAYITLADQACYVRSLRGGGELDFTLTANMCYGYATLATSTICVRENYLDGNTDACDPEESSQVSVSGAPVTINSFSQQTIGTDKLRIQYEVALKDNIDVWAPYNGQDCRPQTRSERINEEGWIYARLDANGNGQIDCVNLQDSRSSNGVTFNGDHIFNYPQEYLSGNAIVVREVNNNADGYLKLGSDNTATLTCTLTLSNQATDSLSTIDLALSYYVEDSISKTFSVTHADGASGGSCGGSSGYPYAGLPPGPNDNVRS